MVEIEEFTEQVNAVEQRNKKRDKREEKLRMESLNVPKDKKHLCYNDVHFEENKGDKEKDLGIGDFY